MDQQQVRARFVELHVIQNFAPSCLNRDDSNAPKDCVFGGYRRARISSQCLKRAARRHFAEARLIPAANLAHRTKRLVEKVAEKLTAKGRDASLSQRAISAALESVKLGPKEGGKTEYLVFLGEQELERLADLCHQHWDALTAVAAAAPQEQQASDDAKPKAARGKKDKAAKAAALPEEIRKAMVSLLDGGKAADLALFGRMLADLPEKNIHAACQVAHALSTHKVEMEFDFYTAVDDFQQEKGEETGAGMMGTVEFNSACFYRYAVIDLEQLRENLQQDAELVATTISAFVQAFVEAIPTGKQNTFAAHQKPHFVLAVVRSGGSPVSLANAFVQPVRPDVKEGLDQVQASIRAFDAHWGEMAEAYGLEGITFKTAIRLGGEPKLEKLAVDPVPFPKLVKSVLAALVV